MTNKPLVSVIVPTKNSATTLEACLQSIRDQTYKKLEIIVVDNSSGDETPEIANRMADKFYTKGPERSAQRNFGVSESDGVIVLIIDSDMELTPDVVTQCVDQFDSRLEVVGLVIPEESFGQGFWAQCKRLERSFYVGVEWMEAARAFRKSMYIQAKGYDIEMVSGEDWDLSQRVAAIGKIGRVNAYIMHNEGRLRLIYTLKKKYNYAQNFAAYTDKNKSCTQKSLQTNLFARYALFIKKPTKLFENPILGIGMLMMKTCEFGFGFYGSTVAKLLR